ncbi:hypothetical protein LIER_41962 [Lithospermum erythrorhizon]|uniref:Uncharacterized protein n=1 Tax=Lithospermum erythrorhizon TaxID=34254 RepID=A0AAV3RKR7_LITER
MSEGVLPMKYLGIPISSKALTCGDYSVLIDKVCNKINNWQSRQLSFGVTASSSGLLILGFRISGVPASPFIMWGYKKKDSDPWFWKKILKVRPLIQDKNSITVNDGESVSFWFDSWCSLGPM